MVDVSTTLRMLVSNLELRLILFSGGDDDAEGGDALANRFPIDFFLCSPETHRLTV
jgi:hypothetical protein